MYINMNLFVFYENFHNIKDRNKTCIYILISVTQITDVTKYSNTETT